MPEIKCKGCGKAIRWLRTETGKLIPVDAETVDKADEYFDRDRHVTHFITCPQAKQFRRKDGKGNKP